MTSDEMAELKNQLEAKSRELTKIIDEKDQVDQKLKFSEEEVSELKNQVNELEGTLDTIKHDMKKV